MRRRTACAVAVAFAVGVAVAGCGSGDDDEAGGAATETTASAGYVDVARKELERFYAGTDRALPSSAPRVQPGKRVWVVACAMAAEGCARPAQALKEAGDKVGWKVTLADGKGDPSQYNAVVRDALNAHADAIVLVAVDCAAVKGPLQEAKRAKVVTFGMFGVDCDDKYGGGGTKLLTGELNFGSRFPSFADFVENELAKAMADYAIAKTDGKAKTIIMREEDTAVIRHIGDGFAREYAKCTSCKAYTVPFTFQDLLTNKLQGKVQAALTKYPDANVVAGPYDASIAAAIAPAVIASGRDKDILLIGNEGLTPNIAQIKAGKGQDVALGAPARWAGYAAVDSLNRLFHGQPLVDEGIGVQAVDREHHPPETPAYEGNVDAQGTPKRDVVADYLRIWGVAG
jgi:ribose transport system substrate-binding protein